jgi:putative glutamine amidotransferase
VNKRVLIPYRHPKKLKPYEEALRAAGLDPLPVYTDGPISLNGVAGLLLMGGTDLNPQLYGQERQPETEQPDEERDRIELETIHEALEKDLPILAICRGLQILNVYHGGTLIQHLPSAARHDSENPNTAAPAHEVTIEPDTLLAKIAGARTWRVNSRHHQAADKVGAGLQVSARDADDNTIEGLERHDKRFVVAVQWHPEDQLREHPEQLKLFERFADALG